jgi:SAM-dependent methyltransferase
MPGPTVEELQKKYGLTYHVSSAQKADEVSGIRGRRVLEVGGSLPQGFVMEELGAAQWVSIEEMAYWHEITPEGGGKAPEQSPRRPLRQVASASELGRYQVLGGGVEDLPPSLEGAFDTVFSLSAFEHIVTLPMALLKMYQALRPGGKLFTMFSPVWSAHDGHHLPDVVDKQGRTFGFASSPIPPWGHLLLRPAQLVQFLTQHTDFETAAKMGYYVYHSPHINRLFIEDYAMYVEASPFKVDEMMGIFEATPPERLKQELLRQYPGRQNFTSNGILMALTRPE